MRKGPEQRARVAILRGRLVDLRDGADPEVAEAAERLATIADELVRTSTWIVGGDGWAYDIGFGGVDHVLGSGRNVNLLVLDTEVYSNTGGQASKSTPRAATAKFASDGKGTRKKDLGLLAQAYGDVYVAQIAIGANETQAVRAFREAVAHDGPSLVIAYSSLDALDGIDALTDQLANVSGSISNGAAAGIVMGGAGIAFGAHALDRVSQILLRLQLAAHVPARLRPEVTFGGAQPKRIRHAAEQAVQLLLVLGPGLGRGHQPNFPVTYCSVRSSSGRENICSVGLYSTSKPVRRSLSGFTSVV